MIVVTPLHTLKETLPKRISELSNASISLVLGLMLMFNTNMFSNAPASWAQLSSIADQEVWAWIAIGLGSARLVALFVNGVYYRTPAIRALGAFASGFLWYQLSISLLPNFSIGAAVFPILLAADIYNGVRASHEAGQAEAKRKNGDAGHST